MNKKEEKDLQELQDSNMKEVLSEEDQKQVELMTREDAPKKTKLELLEETRRAIEEELAKQKADAYRAERERKAAERAAKDLIEQTALDAVQYAQINEGVARILKDVPAKYLKDPTTPIVIAWCLNQGRDMFGHNTVEAGIGVVAQYYRAAELQATKKAEEKIEKKAGE